MKKLFFGWFIILVLVGKSQIVTVFDTDGRIIKTYGPTNATSFKFPGGMKSKNIMIVEDVSPKDASKYYLVYQNRKNDYLYEANLTRFSFKTMQGNLMGNCIYFDLPELKEDSIMSYQLIKTNGWIGNVMQFDTMVRTWNWLEYYKDQLNAKARFKSYLVVNGGGLRISEASKFMKCQEQVAKYKKLLKDENYMDKDTSYHKVELRRKKLNEELATLSLKMEKFASLARSNDVVKSLDSTSEKMIRVRKSIVMTDDSLNKIKNHRKDSLAYYEDKLEIIKKNLGLKNYLDGFKKSSSDVGFLGDPIFTILHQGMLVATDYLTKEVVYDYYPQTIFESKKTTFALKRQTPDLPQLTTDHTLYAKIINIPLPDLRANPIFINLSGNMVNKVAPEDLANGPIIKGLESVDAALPQGLIEKPLSFFKPTPTATVSSKNFIVNAKEIKKLGTFSLTTALENNYSLFSIANVDIFTVDTIKLIQRTTKDLEKEVADKIIAWLKKAENPKPAERESLLKEGNSYLGLDLARIGLTQEQQELFHTRYNKLLPRKSIQETERILSWVKAYHNKKYLLTDTISAIDSARKYSAELDQYSLDKEQKALVEGVIALILKTREDLLSSFRTYTATIINDIHPGVDDLISYSAFIARWDTLLTKLHPLASDEAALKSVKDALKPKISPMKAKILANVKVLLNEPNKTMRDYLRMEALLKLNDPRLDYETSEQALFDSTGRVLERLRPLSKFRDAIIEELTIVDPPAVKYLDYLLKFEKEFEYLSKPQIEMKATAPTYTNYGVDMTDGKAKEVYQIKNELMTFARDEFAPVRKRYRFCLNAGVVWTQLPSYTYEQALAPGSQNTYYLKENFSYESRFVPTLFFSTYFRKNDIYARKKDGAPLIGKFHFDIGIDYYDLNLLDNVYIGIGFEPERNIHIVAGMRMGNYEKVNDLSQVPVNATDLRPYSEMHFGITPYIGINLGFNLIPTAIKNFASLLTK